MTDFLRVMPSDGVAFAEIGGQYLLHSDFIDAVRSRDPASRPRVTKIKAQRGNRSAGLDVFWSSYGWIFSDSARQLLKLHHSFEFSRLIEFDVVDGARLWLFAPSEVKCVLNCGVAACDLNSPHLEREKYGGVRRYEKGRSIALARWWSFDKKLLVGRDSFCDSPGGWNFFSVRLVNTFESSFVNSIVAFETEKPEGNHWRDFMA